MELLAEVLHTPLSHQPCPKAVSSGLSREGDGFLNRLGLFQLCLCTLHLSTRILSHERKGLPAVLTGTAAAAAFSRAIQAQIRGPSSANERTSNNQKDAQLSIYEESAARRSARSLGYLTAFRRVVSTIFRQHELPTPMYYNACVKVSYSNSEK